MISVSLSHLVLIYLCIMLGPIFTAWLFYEWRRQRREQAAFRHVLHCTLCGFEFEDKTSAVLPRCPRCGSLNERFQRSAL
jgi:rubrerythrin